MLAMGQEFSAKELEDMVESVDIDGDGVIDFTEFLGLMAGRMKEPEKKDEYANAFKVFDR